MKRTVSLHSSLALLAALGAAAGVTRGVADAFNQAKDAITDFKTSDRRYTVIDPKGNRKQRRAAQAQARRRR